MPTKKKNIGANPSNKVTINEKEGTVRVELPVLDRHEQARFDKSEDYCTEYGGGSSVFRRRDYNAIKAKIDKCQDYFLKDSLVRRIVELMSQFAATDIQLQGEQKNKSFFKQWMKCIDMRGVIKSIAKEYFRSSNVHIIKSQLPFKGDSKANKPIKLDTKGFKQQGKLSKEYGKWRKDLAALIKNGDYVDEAARKINWTNKMLPYKYTILNPLQVEKQGDATFDLDEVFWTPSKNFRLMIQKNQKKHETIINSLPVMLRQQVKDNKGQIELFNDFYSSIYRMKDSYALYAEPLMTPIFDHLFRKNQMREADTRVIKSVINKILLVKVGDKEYPATTKQLQAMSAILKDPSNVLELIWNHAISIQWIDTDTEFLNKDKYAPVNDDILEGFGVTKILLGNTIDLKGNSWVSLRGLVENIREAQESIEHWLLLQFEEIGEALKMDNVPEPKLHTVNLEDKVNLYKIYQGMVDRGILSNQVVCELIGEDWVRNYQQIKAESKAREEGTLPIIGSPGQKPAEENQPVGTQGKPGVQQPKITPSEIKGSQGRPVGTPTPIPARKEPKLKNAAVGEGETVYEDLQGLARCAVHGLFNKFKDEGQTGEESFKTVSDCMYGFSAVDIADLDIAQYKVNGGADIASADVRNLIVGMRNKVSSKLFVWKGENKAISVPMVTRLDILAEAWASCVPIEEQV